MNRNVWEREMGMPDSSGTLQRSFSTLIGAMFLKVVTSVGSGVLANDVMGIPTSPSSLTPKITFQCRF